jgi:hypothetical protein
MLLFGYSTRTNNGTDGRKKQRLRSSPRTLTTSSTISLKAEILYVGSQYKPEPSPCIQYPI